MNSPLYSRQACIQALLTLAFAVAASTRSLRAEDWTPPAKPDPQTILNQAHADTRAGRFDDALTKHVWFHEHAMEYDQGQYGVRLSFALGYWMELAKFHPPALDKLKATRDAARRRVEEGRDLQARVHDFHELASINDSLEETDATVDAFRALDEADAKAGKRVFKLARPALVEAKEYELCGKYLDPDADWEQMADSFREMREYESKVAGRFATPKFAEPSFINEVSTLVALLVVNKRTEEAEEIALAAKKVSLETDDDDFDAKLAEALDEALKGTVPKPWP